MTRAAGCGMCVGTVSPVVVPSAQVVEPLVVAPQGYGTAGTAATIEMRET
jgi:hypothetical protein